MAGASKIEREERCGVPILSMASRDGVTHGGIVFRVGFADEPLPLRGVSHLIEHLSADVPPGTVNSNAVTDELFTSFFAFGEPRDVQRHLETVCAQLRKLPLTHIERERRILTVEDLAPGGFGTAARLKSLRCGVTGFGARTQPEHGVWNATDEQVVNWTLEHFTTGNAIAYWTGPPPRDLDLTLPQGVRIPPPAFEQLPHVVTPAQSEDATEEVAIGMIATHGPARDLVIDAIQSRVHDSLRTARGVIYGVRCDSDPIDRDRSHVALYVGVFEADAADVRNAFFSALSDLARNGVTTEEVSRFKRDWRIWEAAHEAPVELSDAAEQALLGRTPKTPVEYGRDLELVRQQDVMRVALEMIESAIVSVPEGTPLPSWSDSRVRAIRPPTFEDVTGAVIPGQRRLLGLVRSSSHTLVGDESLGTFSDGAPVPAVTLRYDEAVLAIRHTEGDLTLVRSDGYWVRLDAGHSPERAAIADVLERLDASIVVVTPRHRQMLRLREMAETQLAESTFFDVTVARASEIVRATESIHHVARAGWDHATGLMVITDRRIILAGTKADQLGSRPLSDFSKADIRENVLVLVDVNGVTSRFTIRSATQVAAIAATINRSCVTVPIALF